MPAKPYDPSEHNVAESRQNRIAGKLLARARQASGMSQTEFASAVAKRLGLPSLAQGSLSGWEIHSRTVPAAAIIAAAEVARTHGFNLGQKIDNELGPHKVPQRTILAAALRQMASAMKGDAADSLRAAADSLDER